MTPRANDEFTAVRMPVWDFLFTYGVLFYCACCVIWVTGWLVYKLVRFVAGAT